MTLEVKQRDDIKERYKWDINKVYTDVKMWENDYNSLKENAFKLKEFNGKLNDGQNLLDFIKLREKLSRKLEVLLIYAFLKSDEDTTKTEYQALKSKVQTLSAQVSSYAAFFEPEIIALPEGALDKFIKEVPELKLYEFKFNDILSDKTHILSQKEEALLASASECLGAADNIYTIFSNAELTFPEIKDEDGNTVQLTESSFSKFRISKDKRVREESFKALFGTYDKFKNTCASTLSASIKSHSFLGKARNFNDSLEMSLNPEKIPTGVYDNLIKTINNNLHLLHRYVTLKKRLLNLDEIHMYDLYVPVIEVPDMHIGFEEGVNTVRDGLGELGEEYINIFNKGMENRWVDVYENKGKKNGAYSWGSYDTMPYVLLNYDYQYDGVSTFAHEMGHSIHSYYSRKTQPYAYADYSLFCAEVASTVNECLLINNMINKETDKQKRLYYINQQLEQIRSTVFRQTMFAEFERETHKLIDSGNPLTSEVLCDLYYNINKKYYGNDIVADELIGVEWARIPHFYSDFYVYQYATGYSAAMSFVTAILEKGEEAVEKYKGFLKSGGSDYSINILKKAGVDMATSKPIQDTMNRFEELLDMIDKELGIR